MDESQRITPVGPKKDDDGYYETLGIDPEAPPERIESFQGEHRWLSNFTPATVTLEGVTYPSVEHAYQAAKTVDTEERRGFLEKVDAEGNVTETRYDPDTDEWIGVKPGQAKRLGGGRVKKNKRITIREDWDDVKFQIMEDLTRQKYMNNPALAEKLLATGAAEIIEGNTWGDTFWGVSGGAGANNLGKIIMKVRDELRS